MIARGLRVFLALTVLLAATACASVESRDSQPVAWFDAFALGEVLAEPMETPRIEDVRQAITALWYGPIAVTSGDGRTMSLASCEAYLRAQHQRVRPDDPTYWAPFMGRALTCQAAQLIVTGQLSDHSYVRDLAFDRDLPDTLPWQVAMIISGGERDQIAEERPDASWREVMTLPVTKFETCGEYCGIYDDAGGSQEVRLVARGDFDGDAIEDLLVSSNNAVKGGTYRAIRMFLLTRRQAGGEVELIRELDY